MGDVNRQARASGAAVPWRLHLWRRYGAQDPVDQLVERDPGGVGGLRQQAGLRQAGDHVQLQDVKLRADRVEHQVDARKAGAAEQREGVQRDLPGTIGHLGFQFGRADEPGAADLVAGLEVVEVLLFRDRLDDRQRQRLSVWLLEDRDRQIATRDVSLEQHLAVIGEGGNECRRDLGR